MTEISSPLIRARHGKNWIRLRTLVLLRWWAILGQLTALAIGQQFYHLSLEFGWCYFVVGILALSNLVASTGNKDRSAPKSF